MSSKNVSSSSPWQDSSGARSTARFDVLPIYEKKIDVAAECERLKKEMEQDRKRNRQWTTSVGQ